MTQGNGADIRLLTDNKSLVDYLTTGKDPEEKRLKVDLCFLRELMMNERLEVQHVPSKFQLADVLTKDMSGYQLLQILQNSKKETG